MRYLLRSLAAFLMLSSLVASAGEKLKLAKSCFPDLSEHIAFCSHIEVQSLDLEEGFAVARLEICAGRPSAFYSVLLDENSSSCQVLSLDGESPALELLLTRWNRFVVPVASGETLEEQVLAIFHLQGRSEYEAIRNIDELNSSIGRANAEQVVEAGLVTFAAPKQGGRLYLFAKPADQLVVVRYAVIDSGELALSYGLVIPRPFTVRPLE